MSNFHSLLWGDTSTLGWVKNFRETSIVVSFSKSIDFVKEIKSPEVLFKEDSTFVYLFLKRVKSSTVDGLLNFATKDRGSGLLINGNLDLRLKNTLNEGERLTLFWNRVRENNSEFRFGAQIPYVFNSAISPEFEFHIYRQDSTFVTTSFATKLDYHSINDQESFCPFLMKLRII